MAGVCGAETVQDLVVGYMPNGTTPNQINLTTDSPTWTADLSSYANWLSQVYCIMGYDYWLGGDGHADIMYSSIDNDLFGNINTPADPNAPVPVPYVICGSAADGSTGYFVYKFTLPSGYITAAGSTIDANIIFRGDRTSYVSSTYLGVSPLFTPYTTSTFQEIANAGDFVKATMTGGTSGEWDSYVQHTVLAIPAGMNVFYIAVVKDWGGQNRFGFTRLVVNVAMTTGTPTIPDVPQFSQFVPGLYPNATTPKQILLSKAKPAWDANLATAPAFANDVYAIMGYQNGSHQYSDLIYRKADNGWFNVTHQPYISCDQSLGTNNIGSFVYKFVLPDGMVTGTGGTINAGCFLRGTPSTLNWIGVSTNYYPGSSSYTEIGDKGDFTKAYVTGNTWGVYEQNLTLSIPAGVTSFYVALMSDWSSSNYFGMYSMHVSAVLKDGVLPVLMYYMPDNRLLKYELDRMATNDIGMSGAVLGGWNIGDDPNATGGVNVAKQSYKDIVTAAQGKTPAINNFAIKTYIGYATSTWPANTWVRGSGSSDPWNKAIANFTALAQTANYAGVAHIIIDGERYTNLDTVTFSGSYILNMSDSTNLSLAYQRGIEVAQAISAAAPGVDLILMPEYGSGYIGSVGSYMGWQKFRSGLLHGTSTLKVYVGVEGTYTALTGVNDKDIQLDGVSGSFTDTAAYKIAVTNYLNTINSNVRSSTDYAADWDSRGGIVPGYWVLGTSGDRNGKRSAWYTPAMFAAQLEAYKALNVPLIFEWAPIFAWKQWYGNEVAAAGMYPYDGNPNPDNNNNWMAELACHPYLSAYKAVLRARGTPSPMYSFPQAGDVSGDSYVNFNDIKGMATQWLNH
jgi:hypothetical protein